MYNVRSNLAQDYRNGCKNVTKIFNPMYIHRPIHEAFHTARHTGMEQHLVHCPVVEVEAVMESRILSLPSTNRPKTD